MYHRPYIMKYLSFQQSSRKKYFMFQRLCNHLKEFSHFPRNTSFLKFNVIRKKWLVCLPKRLVVSDVFLITTAKILSFCLRNNETQKFL